MYLSVEERRDRVATAGPNAAEVADALSKLKKHVAAKQLGGLLSDLKRYGPEAFERICAWVTEHKALTWEGFQRGVDEIMNGGEERRRWKWTRNVSTSVDPNRNIRGAEYYKKRG